MKDQILIWNGHKCSPFLEYLKSEANFHRSNLSVKKTNEQQPMSSSNFSYES